MITATPTPQRRAERQIAELRGLLGQRLFRATLAAMPATGKARRAVLDFCPYRRLLPIARALDKMELLCDLLALCREKKKKADRMENMGAGRRHDRIGPWEYGPPPVRLLRAIQVETECALNYLFRTPNDLCIEVSIAGDLPGDLQLGIFATLIPGDRFPGLRKQPQGLYIEANLPRNWMSTVYRRGLATAGGMFTVSAAFHLAVSHPAGQAMREITFYHAHWARPGRGYSIIMESGFIATDGTIYYHSTRSASHALRGITRKLDQTTNETR